MTCPNCATPCAQPPDDIEFTADGVFVKQMYIEKAGTLIPQHAHTYDHLSMLAAGRVRIWEAGVLVGDKTAPAAIFIKANVKHKFLSLDDKTVIYCIHKLHGPSVEIAAEHQLSQET